MDLNFDVNFKLTVHCLKTLRCHPIMRRDRKWLVNYIFGFGFYTIAFTLFVYNIYLNLKMNDFNETCKNGVLCVVYFVSTFQQSMLFWKRANLLELITCMNEDYEKSKFLPSDEQKIVYEYIEKGKYVCKQWLTVTSVGCAIFPIKNLGLMIYQYVIGDPKLLPIYDVIYPDIIEENKENIFLYPILYTHLFFYALYTGYVYLAFVPLGPIFMLHLSGQLEIVKGKINNIFENETDVEEKLKDVVVRLQYIYSFEEKLVLALGVNYELTLKATAICLPINCYELIETFHQGELSAEFLVFIVGAVLISSSPCYYGTLLMDKSEEMRFAIYSSGWESNYNMKARRTIIIILIRALKPVAIQTPFRTLCLDALTDVFQQSYTIFNLMNAMWE